MRQCLITFFAFLLCAFLYGQKTPNPYESLGIEVEVLTLSKGKYQEFHDLDSIQQIGTVLINLNTNEVVGIISHDTIPEEYYMPKLSSSRWISPDPLAEEMASYSPYAYGFNNPIKYVDPTGLMPEDAQSNCPPDCPNPTDIWGQITTALSEFWQNLGFNQDDTPSASETMAFVEETGDDLQTIVDVQTALIPGGSLLNPGAGDGEKVLDVALSAIPGMGLVDDAGKAVVKTANNLEVSKFSIHAVNRAIDRGVKPGAILDALKNPLKVGDVITDDLGRQSQRFIGQKAEVVINPNTGVVVTLNPTSIKKAQRLLKQQNK